jgi:hypothetical protein
MANGIDCVITDILCTHSIKTGNVEFLFELNESGHYMKFISSEGAAQHATE